MDKNYSIDERVKELQNLRQEMGKKARPSIAMQQFEQRLRESAMNRKPGDYARRNQDYVWSQIGHLVVGAEYYPRQGLYHRIRKFFSGIRDIL